nr:MAG TPA: hypothetical protein [Caudoviricetes sp.]
MVKRCDRIFEVIYFRRIFIMRRVCPIYRSGRRLPMSNL